MATLQDVLQALNKVAGSINKTGQAFTSGVANAGRNLGVGAYGGYRLGRAGVSGARALPFFNRQTAMGQVGALGGAAAGASTRAVAQQATAAKLGYNHASKLRQIAAMQQQNSKLTAMVQGNPRLMAHRAKVEALRQKYEDAKTAHAARPTAQSMRRVGIRQKKYEEENQKLNLNPLHAKQTKSLQELTNAQSGYEKQLSNLSPLQKFNFQLGRIGDGLSKFYDPLKKDTALMAKRAIVGGTAAVTAMAYKGFQGTVQGERFANESAALSREIAAIFAPVLGFATGFTRVIRQSLEGMDGSQQKKMMVGGLGVAGGLMAAKTGVGGALLSAAPEMIGGGMGAISGIARGGLALGRGALQIGGGILGTGIGAASAGAAVLGAGFYNMGEQAQGRIERNDQANQGKLAEMGLTGDEYGYKERFGKIANIDERNKAIREEQTNVVRGQNKDPYQSGFHRNVVDALNDMTTIGGENILSHIGIDTFNGRNARRQEGENRSAILQNLANNPDAFKAPEQGPLDQTGQPVKTKLMLAQAGFAGAGSSFEDLQSEVLKKTGGGMEGEKEGEAAAKKVIELLTSIERVLTLKVLNPMNWFAGDGGNAAPGAKPA